MDIFTLFNTKQIKDRQTDTLIGLSKGLAADGKVNQAEAEFLLSWLIQNSQVSNSPIIENLLIKVSAMLDDDFLDADESAELLAILKMISGDASEIGELAKSASLPVCQPAPPVSFKDKTFMFTGTCAFGTRKQCKEATESLGGINSKGKDITKSLDYLVLGKYVTASWAHEAFGRKIEKAMEYREKGIPIAIITEEHWIAESGLSA